MRVQGQETNLRHQPGAQTFFGKFIGFPAAAVGGAPFCTDGGRFTAAGISSLICGPGELEQAHQPDESVSRAAFESGSEHIVRVIGRLCVS